ncbi:MAG: MvaI/BcnI family restriction endonuclease [Bacteroidota bacterium]
MDLSNLKQLFSKNGCKKIYAKVLAANDNSKQQVYLAGSFDLLNIFPIAEIHADNSGGKVQTFKATLNFSWIDDEGKISLAPESKLILYPDYPEVRFSGFLKRCSNPPSHIMTSRQPGRIFFISVTPTGALLGYVADADSQVANEFRGLSNLEIVGVFKVINLNMVLNAREKLLAELRRIHLSGWIDSKRLDKFGSTLPCDSSNCGGYTLEAELGIRPNGYSEPDYLGYEIKQFNAASFDKIAKEVITLMTPEPNGGHYSTEGVESFIRKYGYADRNGRPDRLNFGGVHKVGSQHHLTNLRLELDGFNASSGKITNVSGSINLLDKSDTITASWSFSSLLKHWNLKHNLACYVPSKTLKAPNRMYSFGNRVLLGNGTDFQLFLAEMCKGNIYYDPGIKLENASSSKPSPPKRRSQFRIKSEHLKNVYHSTEFLDLLL